MRSLLTIVVTHKLISKLVVVDALFRLPKKKKKGKERFIFKIA